MKRRITIPEREYLEQQSTIMDETQRIIDSRTRYNGRQIVKQLEELQRRAYPEFYRSEYRRKPAQTPTRPAQPAATTTEPQEISTEPCKLNAAQFITGLFYFIANPIRCKARK